MHPAAHALFSKKAPPPGYREGNDSG